MGWDACYVRLLYKSILELWLDDNISSLTCRVFAHLADHREWEAELTKGFHRDRSRVQEEQTMAEETQVTNDKCAKCCVGKWFFGRSVNMSYVGHDAGPGSFYTWNVKG